VNGPCLEAKLSSTLTLTRPLNFVEVRSDNEKIAVDLDIVPVERPETVF
jgi:hypothetical protein